jgi:hypothetical protein
MLAVMLIAVPASQAGATSFEDNLRQMPVGEPEMVSTFGWPDAETVCLLQPYQDRVLANGDVAESLKARLNNKPLEADEGHFIFLVDVKRGLQLVRIKRSAQLDVLGVLKLPAEVSVPDQFVQAECAAGAAAAVVKAVVRGRVYVLFGTVHR